MTIAAGIDVGNSTTEVVLARLDDEGVRPLYAARAKTVGEKGSPESLKAAARVLQRAERVSGLVCERIALSELHPVRTLVAQFPRPTSTSAPLTILTGESAPTPFGSGLVHGQHVPVLELGSAPISDSVIVSVPKGVDYEAAAQLIASGLANGWQIVGAVLAADEAVLVGNRLPRPIPIADEVAIEDVERGARLALEVAEPGETITGLSDPVGLAAVFGLRPSAVERIAPLARGLSDARVAVLTTTRHRERVEEQPDEGWIEYIEGGREINVPLASIHHDLLRCLRPGSVRRLQPPLGSDLAGAVEGYEDLVRDLYISDLPALRERSSVRRGSARLDAVPVSVYIKSGLAADAQNVLGEATQRPVSVESNESRAARLGALSTPAAPHDAMVCDLGGGTIDVVGESGAVIAAGAGELLTMSVAFALGLARGLAEYVKRSPSVRVEAPHLVRHEDGSRDFLSSAAQGEAVGRLCIRRGDALLPFTDTLSPEEWRALRLSMKAQVIAGNIGRCLDALKEPPRVLLLCGGAAEDKELTRIVADWVGARGTTAGRTNVAGRYGPRYAVAIGLVLMMAKKQGLNDRIDATGVAG